MSLVANAAAARNRRMIISTIVNQYGLTATARNLLHSCTALWDFLNPCKNPKPGQYAHHIVPTVPQDVAEKILHDNDPPHH